MEESEYKSTYDALTTVPCVFEKLLTNNKARCSLSSHFWLADREGYACQQQAASARCGELLEQLGKNSVFVFKRRDRQAPLPHNMALRLQAGGIRGLAQLLEKEKNVITDEQNTGDIVAADFVSDDINALINAVIADFGSLQRLPYSKIVQSVVQFQGRSRRR